MTVSNYAMNWAKTWRDKSLSVGDKAVLLNLCDHYNDKVHRSWPSTARIADETGLARRSVVRSLQKLELMGLIETETWINNDNCARLNNRYCLPLYDPASNRARHLPVLLHNGSSTAETVLQIPDNDAMFDALLVTGPVT